MIPSTIEGVVENTNILKVFTYTAKNSDPREKLALKYDICKKVKFLTELLGERYTAIFNSGSGHALDYKNLTIYSYDSSFFKKKSRVTDILINPEPCGFFERIVHELLDDYPSPERVYFQMGNRVGIFKEEEKWLETFNSCYDYVLKNKKSIQAKIKEKIKSE